MVHEESPPRMTGNEQNGSSGPQEESPSRITQDERTDSHSIQHWNSVLTICTKRTNRCSFGCICCSLDAHMADAWSCLYILTIIISSIYRYMSFLHNSKIDRYGQCVFFMNLITLEIHYAIGFNFKDWVTIPVPAIRINIKELKCRCFYDMLKWYLEI